jgi:hypothetical protein
MTLKRLWPLLAVLVTLAVAAAAAAAPELLATVPVARKGAAEICLNGSKAPGAALELRVEVWRKTALLGTTTVPDHDARAVFSACRPITPARAGDVVKVLSVGVRPKSVTATLRPDGTGD